MKWQSYKFVTMGVATIVLACSATGCQSYKDVSSVNHLSVINADPSLFAPPTDDKYSLHGEIVTATVTSQGVPLEQVSANANGSITVTDGIMSNAEITATIDNFHQIKFELTEPVMFERKGQLSDVIVGVGKLTTTSGVINDVKMVLSPHFSQSKTTFDATIEIPASLTLDLNKKPAPLKLKLELSPAV